MIDELERKRKQHELENVMRDPTTRVTGTDLDLFDIVEHNGEQTILYSGTPYAPHDIVDEPLGENVVITHVDDYQRKPLAHHAWPLFDSFFRDAVNILRRSKSQRSDHDNPE